MLSRQFLNTLPPSIALGAAAMTGPLASFGQGMKQGVVKLFA